MPKNRRKSAGEQFQLQILSWFLVHPPLAKVKSCVFFLFFLGLVMRVMLWLQYFCKDNIFVAVLVVFSCKLILLVVYDGLVIIFLILGLMRIDEACHYYELQLVYLILLLKHTHYINLLFQNTHLLGLNINGVIIQIKRMSLYYPQGGQISKARSNNQSLLAVYLQSFVYYDEIYSYFAIIFQYFIFVYKYNILFYASSTIAGEIILLTLLLPINSVRIYSVRAGNKGKKYSFLALFLLLDILVVIGTIYIIAIQTNALYLQVIISIIELVLSGINFVMAIILMIMYRANQ